MILTKYHLVKNTNQIIPLLQYFSFKVLQLNIYFKFYQAYIKMDSDSKQIYWKLPIIVDLV